MKCPYCQNDGHVVTETRTEGASIYRRRRCKRCYEHFVTIESAPEGLKMPKALNNSPTSRLKPGQTAYQAPEIGTTKKRKKVSTGVDLQKVWG